MAGRRLSMFVSTCLTQPQEEPHLLVDDVEVSEVKGQKRTVIHTGELSVFSVPAKSVPAQDLERLGYKAPIPDTLTILLCGQHVSLIKDRTIFMKKMVPEPVYATPTKGAFLEFKLTEDDCDAEVETLDLLLREHATLRELKPSGEKVVKNRYVTLTEEGKLLEDGIGDHIAAELRSSCHFIAKRVLENREALLEKIRDTSNVVKEIMQKHPPGGELRIHDDTIKQLRVAALLVETAHTNCQAQVDKFLRSTVTTGVGKAVGDEFHESQLGQRMAKHRGLREFRRIALASIDGTDELFASLKGFRRDILQAVLDAVLEVVYHVWGPKAMEIGRHSLVMLVEFMCIKWAMVWARPSALAILGLK
eukprot:Sspe_Gene.13786::Locus_4744_Transcript_1_1_Confidence_1.000_Length_1157::g.13786::m.13786